MRRQRQHYNDDGDDNNVSSLGDGLVAYSTPMFLFTNNQILFSPILFYVKEKSNSFRKKSINYDIAM